MRKIFTLSTFFISNLLFAQANPGNVGITNLTAWFRGDDLTPGYSVTSWSTTYPTIGTTGFSLTPINVAGPYPYANANPPKNFSNYNTTVDFTGSSDVNNLGLTYIPSGTLNLLDNSLTISQGTMFVVYYIPDTSLTIAASGQHIVYYREANSGGDGIQFRRLAPLNRCAIGSSNNVNATRDYSETYKPSIFSYKGNYYNSMGAYLSNSTIPASSIASSTSGYKGLFIGTRYSGSYAGSYPGYISEVIFYNTNLTTAQFAQVNTYLAIKYGITLNNGSTALGGNGNYVNTNGTTIWNAATVDSIYHHDVIGIGRDDNEGLYQKQSHSFDDSTRIYVGTLATTNVLNINSISNDTSYAIIGHNIASSCAASNSTEYPTGAGIYSRIDREWKIVKSNLVDNVSVDLTLNNCANIGNISLSDLRLLVDYDDGNFINATVMTSTSGVSFSLNGNVLTVSGISSSVLPTTGYITIASVNSNTPLPIQNIDLKVNETAKHTAQIYFAVNTTENMLAYDVERSRNGQNWTSISHIIANNKIAINNIQNYEAFDNAPLIGKSFYRIKATDIKNDNYYSTIQEFNVNTGTTNHFVYPNPASDFINIQLTTAELKTIKIYNAEMQDMSSKVMLNSTNNMTNLNIQNLPSGMYFIKTNDFSTSFVKQ